MGVGGVNEFSTRQDCFVLLELCTTMVAWNSSEALMREIVRMVFWETPWARGQLADEGICKFQYPDVGIYMRLGSGLSVWSPSQSPAAGPEEHCFVLFFCRPLVISTITTWVSQTPFQSPLTTTAAHACCSRVDSNTETLA